MKVGTTSTIEQAAYACCCSYSLQNTKSEVIAAAVCCGVASAVMDEHDAPVCKQVCVYRHLYDTFMQERRNTQMAHRKNAATLKKKMRCSAEKCGKPLRSFCFLLCFLFWCHFIEGTDSNICQAGWLIRVAMQRQDWFVLLKVNHFMTAHCPHPFICIFNQCSAVLRFILKALLPV